MTRTYTMRARAESALATHQRILQAAERAFLDRWYDEVTLDHVAEEAGVSKQTVLRRFGSKEALFAAVADDVMNGGDQARAKVPTGDLDRASAVLTAEHERTGLTVARLEAMEERFPALEQHLERSRANRRTWVERTLAPVLPPKANKSYKRRLAQVMDITSAQTWKSLRHGAGLARKDTERAIRELLGAVQQMPR